MFNHKTILGFFSAGSLSKKESNVMLREKSTNHIASDVKQLLAATVQCLWNPSLIIPFFSGPLYAELPHVRAGNPLGHLHFTSQNADELTKAAQKTPNGIATFWAGPFPVLYVTSNAARQALVRESHVGIVDQASSDYLHWLSGGNKVMGEFLDFSPIDSKAYATQRRFLLQFFHKGAKERLPEIEKATVRFLRHYCDKQNESAPSLQALVTTLILHTTSYLLGLTQTTLDTFYSEYPDYARAIDRIAQYGISERGDRALEKILYQLFLQLLENNFDKILHATADDNLIRNIFAALDVPFPQMFTDFAKISRDTQVAIAMNFASMLGAMVHSTGNTLDWALARLLKDRNKLDEFTALMATHKDLDLTQENIFDKDGELFPICAWVLHNVFLYPPFSHEFFLNRKSFAVTLVDHSTIHVPSDSFILVNYMQCNRSNAEMLTLENFSASLKAESTIGRFIMDPRIASFGGSVLSKENHKSRVCPGAKTSLYEQMIMIAILLRDYSLALTDVDEISCEVDTSKHPLCARQNVGFFRAPCRPAPSNPSAGGGTEDPLSRLRERGKG